MCEVKLGHCSVIKFLAIEGDRRKTVHETMIAVNERSSPSYFQAKYWSKQFEWDRESIEDDPRSEKPIKSRPIAFVSKVDEIVLTDTR